MNARLEFNGDYLEICSFKYYPEYSAYNTVSDLKADQIALLPFIKRAL